MPLVETRGAASAQGFGEFAQASAPVYIEDVFSTYLYTSTGFDITVTNGIDLSTKGGLVWIKSRSNAFDHYLTDTVRGAGRVLYSDLVNGQSGPGGGGASSFSTTGYVDGNQNASPITQVSWTFREQPKFFDVVTYTGTGSNRTIAHSLGSVPACIMVKRTDTAGAWQVYHRSLANTEYLVLNSTATTATNANRWNSTTPTSTVFSLGTDATVNASGGTYVAYIFAHDAGGFGLTGTDNVISCGSYTGNGSTQQDITLGYEPQWLMIKRTDTADQWIMVDNMRGFFQTADNALCANNAAAEAATVSVSGAMQPIATGFHLYNGNSSVNANGGTYIYMAIRRGPMKVPTTGTSVFTPVSNTSPTTGNLTDLTINRQPTGNQSTWAISRLTNAGLETQSTNAQTSTSSFIKFDVMTGVTNNSWLTNSDSIWWNFKRAPSVFDVVVSAGTGSSNQARTHNLGVTPELIIVKDRISGAANWVVYSATLGQNYYLNLNNTNNQQTSTGAWGTSSYTATTFYCNDTGTWCASIGNSGVFYLFATCAGVSKVGSYTGTGALQTVNCGFTSGARFVLIKRTDQSGDWWTYDSARGISSGNDPYLFLNSTAPQVTNTNYVDTDTTGFKVTAAAPAGLNATGGTYIFLAIA